MRVLGLDIGGANLKAAHSEGQARLAPFALWKNPEDLPRRLKKLIGVMPAWDVLAVSMTGELCDCFASKREGVRAILEAVQEIVQARPIRVWTNHGRFVDIAAAREDPLPVAAANWLALATWVCAGRGAGLQSASPASQVGDLSHGGILIDVGSTTTDIIPWERGRPIPRGLTDRERLRSGELVYTGVRRTPVCALLGLRRAEEHFAAELFATTLDINLVLGLTAEDPADCDTADGRPATRAMAHARLARMIGADAETCSAEDVVALARRALRVQTDAIADALEQVGRRLLRPPQGLFLAGAGEFLARRIVEQRRVFPGCPLISLSARLGRDLSRCACAYAVACLTAYSPRPLG